MRDFFKITSKTDNKLSFVNDVKKKVLFRKLTFFKKERV